MTSRLVRILTADEPPLRDTSLHDACASLDVEGLLAECDALEGFRHAGANLYASVRALLFLAAIHRYELPRRRGFPVGGRIPFEGFQHLLRRRYEEAIDAFGAAQREQGPADALSSALAAAYRGRAFQTLSDQVRRSVRSVRGNQWMFRIGHGADQPLRIRSELLSRSGPLAPFPVLCECTPVRMDLTHSAWSDIFFLGMDHPGGARVVNTSIDLGVRGRDASPAPPIETCLRVIDEPVLRLVSVDLECARDIDTVAEVFDFARDHLGLLKAGVIAAGIVPPGLEGAGGSLVPLLERLCGPGLGLEVVTRVRDIPKGSRLAVSTNLLASILAVSMRATGQAASLTGPLEERERRIVAARAILGEWLGGSGGGWQDSGGIWPGLKLITGRIAEPQDPEYGVSRGRLLPDHEVLDGDRAPDATFAMLQDCLVLVHGGMAQNVGPILDLVTEKYLLRSADAWAARLEAQRLCDVVLGALANADVRALARATTANFDGPIETIVPWANNAFTADVRARVRERFGDAHLGFCMLGGMAGGGMGFFFTPGSPPSVRDELHEILLQARVDHEDGTPFAMDPVVYDFAVNRAGTVAELRTDARARLAPQYYALVVPDLLRRPAAELSPGRRRELEGLGLAGWSGPDRDVFLPMLFERLLPARPSARRSEGRTLAELLELGGFDRELHERIRADLLAGRIGLAQNRLPATTTIEDVSDDDVVDAHGELPSVWRARGRAAIANGEVCVVTLAAGAASRWSGGAGAVKALDPFVKLGGGFRSFLDVHLAKTRRVATELDASIPHVVTTSLFTHDALARHIERRPVDPRVPVILSPGRAVGLRMVPMVRDLRFLWEETAHQVLDEQAQKVRESYQHAIQHWAARAGEASDYVDNAPMMCLHPVGHWYEIPNLLRNGVLAALLRERPRLRYLLVHNVDTVGADVDPARLGLHAERRVALSYEVVPRRVDDVGGGLAKVDGRARLVEGLAMPDDRTEFRLRHYNTGTTWIDLEPLLELFGLGRGDLGDAAKVASAVRRVGERMPTYVTIKNVKRRWGQGQEDVFPVAQFEKLWGDMTLLPEVRVDFHVVPRERGRQLKDPAWLDGWLRDGSADYVERLCKWPDR